MSPAVNALALGVVGKLTAGAGRRREPPERATGGKCHAASKLPRDARGQGRIDPYSAGLMRRAVRQVLLEHAPPASPRGGARWILRCMLAVYRALCRMAEVFSELHPAIETIAARAGYSVRHTHRALKALKSLALIDWDRRCVPTDQPAPRGGFIVQQISSVYRLLTPPALAQVLEQLRTRGWKGDKAAAERASAAELEHDKAERNAVRDAEEAEELISGRTDREAARVVYRAVPADFEARMAARIAADRTRVT